MSTKESIRFESVLAPEKRGFVYECSSTARWDQCYRASNILSYQSFFFDTYGDRGIQHSGLCCVGQDKTGVDWILSLAKHLTEHPEEYDYTLDSLFGFHINAETVLFLKGIEKTGGYYSISERKVSKSSSKQYDKRWMVIPESAVSLNYFLDRIVDLYLVARTDTHRMTFLELVGLHLRVAEHLGTYVSISASDKLCKWLSEDMLQAAGLLYSVIGSLRTMDFAKRNVEAMIGNQLRAAAPVPAPEPEEVAA